MKRIILFRYHHQFGRNFEFLKFLKHLNQDIEIYGLYGGPKEDFPESCEVLKPVLKHNYILQHSSLETNWKSSDKSFQDWYNNHGNQLEFDILHCIEWDLLMLQPINVLYKDISRDMLAVTGLIPIGKIENHWYWTKHNTKKSEWQKLKEYFHEKYSFAGPYYGMLGPGIAIPRSFLENIKNIEIPDLSNDELRIPIFAQIAGNKLVDTGFFKKWLSRSESKYFNSNSKTINIKTIEKEMRKKFGRRVFHPCDQYFKYDELLRLSKLNSKESFFHSVIEKLL